MTAVADAPVVPVEVVAIPGRVRWESIDRARGLAVVLMVLDHVLELGGFAHSPLRFTVTRVALPLFFVIAGHLCKRWHARHWWVLLVGLSLPALVPWIDNPNVLALYAAGAALVVAGRRSRYMLALLVVLPLTLFANGFVPAMPGAYEPYALIGLMALGAMLPPQAFGWGFRLPRFLAAVGRFPLTVYVGHLLVLQLVAFGGFGRL